MEESWTLKSREMIERFNPIEGMGPNGEPMIYQIAEGEIWGFTCPDCGEVNGGHVVSERNPTSQAEEDSYSPLNRPCVFCRQGPCVWASPYPDS